MIKLKLLLLFCLIQTICLGQTTGVTMQFSAPTTPSTTDSIGYNTVPARPAKAYFWNTVKLRQFFLSKADSLHYITPWYLNQHFSSSTYMDLINNQVANGVKTFRDGINTSTDPNHNVNIGNVEGITFNNTNGSSFMNFQNLYFFTPSSTLALAFSPSYGAGNPGYNLFAGTVTHYLMSVIHEDTLRALKAPMDSNDVVRLRDLPGSVIGGTYTKTQTDSIAALKLNVGDTTSHKVLTPTYANTLYVKLATKVNNQMLSTDVLVNQQVTASNSGLNSTYWYLTKPTTDDNGVTLSANAKPMSVLVNGKSISYLYDSTTSPARIYGFDNPANSQTIKIIFGYAQ